MVVQLSDEGVKKLESIASQENRPVPERQPTPVLRR